MGSGSRDQWVAKERRPARRRPAGGRVAIALVLLAGLGALAAALAPAGAADDGAAEPIGLIGAVQDVAEDQKSFRLKAPKGPFEVTWEKKTRFEVHEQKTLAEIEASAKIHILAEPVEATPATSGGNFPPQLIKVQAIVVGASFVPPPVPEKLAAQRIRWVTGDLVRKGKEIHIEGSLLGAGGSREVLVVKQGKPGAPAVKSALFVAGHLRVVEKTKKLAATEIIQIAAEYPSYDLTHDLKNRKAAPEAKKKEDFGV